jgi:hypothetical protein
MFMPPSQIMTILHHFQPVFSRRVWDWAQVLVIGAILAPGKRTVTAVLRVMGLSKERQFQNYHRVLNRAVWSSLALSKILLGLLVTAFSPADAPLVLGADDTLERRRGAKIKAKGSFRDTARSSSQQAISSEGLRWMSMMLLVPVRWSKRGWALPFLTVLAPTKVGNAALGKRHKTTIDWVCQMISQVRRWLPERTLVLVVDGALCAVKLGLRCARFEQPVTFVSRLRLDAQLYDPPSAKPPGRPGPLPSVGARQPRLKTRLTDPLTAWLRQSVVWYGGRTRQIEYVSGIAWWRTTNPKDPLPLRWVLVRDPFGTFDPLAFLCTDLTATPQQIIAWYVRRWNVEVTFQEVRAHLGFETQRQWSDLAIERTSPLLLGLFSLVTLLAHHLSPDQPLPVRSAAWYPKHIATFSDCLAFVRAFLWQHTQLSQSPFEPALQKIPPATLHNLIEAIYYAA